VLSASTPVHGRRPDVLVAAEPDPARALATHLADRYDLQARTSLTCS
jgi:hypothetical protein